MLLFSLGSMLAVFVARNIYLTWKADYNHLMVGGGGGGGGGGVKY